MFQQLGSPLSPSTERHEGSSMMAIGVFDCHWFAHFYAAKSEEALIFGCKASR
jgi:hypothetical protein